MTNINQKLIDALVLKECGWRTQAEKELYLEAVDTLYLYKKLLVLENKQDKNEEEMEKIKEQLGIKKEKSELTESYLMSLFKPNVGIPSHKKERTISPDNPIKSKMV